MFLTNGSASISLSVVEGTTSGTARRDDANNCVGPQTTSVSLSPATTWTAAGPSPTPSSGTGTTASFTVNDVGSATASFIAQANTTTPPQRFTANKSVKKNVVDIATQTEAMTPPDRTRKTVGVCEKVTCSITGPVKGTVTWSATGKGTVSATSGNSVAFEAADTAGAASVTATLSNGLSKTVNFTVIVPIGVKMEPTKITQGVAPLGLAMELKVWIQPDTVNFYGVVFHEETCSGIGVGYFATNPPSHVPNPASASGNNVVSGKGTYIGTDHAEGSTHGPTYTAGKLTWNIPWGYQKADGFGSWHQFKIVPQVKELQINSTTGKATLTLDKAGAHAEVTDE